MIKTTMKQKVDKPLFFKSEGDAVIEDSALCSFLDNIDDTPSSEIPSLISNLARVAEALVFFERLFVFSYPLDADNTEAYYMSHNPLTLASIIDELSKEKILNFVSVLPTDYAPPPSLLLAQAKKIGIVNNKSIAKFNEFNFTDYLYQQEVTRQIDLPFISSDSAYVKLFVKDSNALKNILSQKLIQSINTKLSKEFDELLNYNHDIKFFVPPLLAILLENVTKGASFGEALMELRSQFQPIRKLFAQYNAELQNPNKSLKQQFEYVTKISREIERVSSSFPIKDRTTLTIWGDTFDFLIDSATDLKNFNPIESVNLIPKLSRLSEHALTQLILKHRYSSIYKL